MAVGDLVLVELIDAEDDAEVVADVLDQRRVPAQRLDVPAGVGGDAGVVAVLVDGVDHLASQHQAAHHGDVDVAWASPPTRRRRSACS